MSARVNLLPREIEERARSRRAASWTIFAVFAFMALLGLIYVLKLASVNESRRERDAAQQVVTQRQAEVASLRQYAELDQQVKARNELLSAAMSTEISWARVFNDLALTFPGSSSLVSLDARAEGADETGESGQGNPNPNSKSIASLEFTGYSVERYAPGVERALLKFSDVSMFFNSYLSEAADEFPTDGRRTDFIGQLQLNDEARTGRYEDGLPPEVGQ